MYQYLYLLKSVNPLYRHIAIDDSPAMRDQLKNISDQLKESVIMIEEEVDLINEMVANPPVSQDALVEESQDAVDESFPNALPSSFVSRLQTLDTDPRKSTRVALQGTVGYRYFKNWFFGQQNLF